MSNEHISPKLRELCDKVTGKRPKTVIDHILKHGQITTEELQELYNYDHPPRAARDVREQGIPLLTSKEKSQRTGRQIGVYKFGNPKDIKKGRIGGRKVFPKAFKAALVQKYGERDTITMDPVCERYLQIDHRVPYEVAGDSAYNELDLDAYMLLDASSQRAKSFSCEACENWKNIHDVDICNTCYWAFPENYTHAAMEEIRRIDLRWSGDEEVAVFERLKAEAEREGLTINSSIKQRLREL